MRMGQGRTVSISLRQICPMFLIPASWQTSECQEGTAHRSGRSLDPSESFAITTTVAITK